MVADSPELCFSPWCMSLLKEGAFLDCLAASYRLDLDGGAYVHHLVGEAAPLLDRGFGVIAYTYDARDPARPLIEHLATSERFDPSWLSTFNSAVESAGIDRGRERHPTGFRAWGHLTCGQASAVPAMRPFLPLFSHFGGSQDAFAVNALDASGRGLWLAAPLPSTARIPPPHVSLFTRFAAHLTSALRLRNASADTPAPHAAVLRPDGALLDARDDAVAAREDLRRATLAFERARSREMRSREELASKRWRPLVVSRWSLLDEFDTDGQRFIVAVENAPPTPTSCEVLSERELQIMTQAHLGHTDKEIAYELGLAASTVRVLLHRAVHKLGASTRGEALARFHELTQRRSD